MNKTEFFVFGLNTLPTNPANIKPGGLYFIQIDNSDLYELWFRNKSNTAWMQLGNVNKGEFLKTFNGLTGELILGASLNVDNDLEITISNSSLTETIVVDLSDFATKDWVQNQNYLTEHQSLEDYATKVWVGLEGFLKATDLNGYATEQWVQNQNYLIQSDLSDYYTSLQIDNFDFAPKSWVIQKIIDSGGGLYTEGEGISIDSNNTISAKFGTGVNDVARGNDSRINNGQTAFGWGDHADAGYATENWVSSQGFLTQHQDLSGYATESWVSSQGFSTQTLDNIEDTTEGVKVTGQVQANALIGRATNSNVSGVYTIDLNNLSENYNLVLTDNTTIDFSNMITEDETAVFTAVVEGAYTITVTGLDLDLDGDAYNTAGRNLIVIHIEKGGVNYRGTYTIKNI